MDARARLEEPNQMSRYRKLNGMVTLLVLALLLVAQGEPDQTAKPEQMILRIVPTSSSSINHNRLLKIKQFVIQQGRRTTYCNMYNNNPSYRTAGYEFFLNPDVGQKNVNCEIGKSDFNQLTIRKVNGGPNSYRTLNFLDPGFVELEVPWPSDDLTSLEARQFVEEALDELQVDIDTAR